jgi:RNA polymerase sigma-70 factor, ECF subfamily
MNEEQHDRMAVERCLRGDTEAFGALIDRYERPVFNTVLHMVGNAEDARELCQQVFMKAFEHLSSYDPQRKFFSWIYRIAINEAINHVKGRRSHQPLNESFVNPHADPAERFAEAEQWMHLHEAIMKLDANYRAVIILRHFLHLSYVETADIMNVPEKTVKSRLFTARKQLRDAMQARGYAAH